MKPPEPGQHRHDDADVEIRVATPEDQSALIALLDRDPEITQKELPGSVEALRDIENGYLNDEGASRLWLALENDEIVGVVGAKRSGDHKAEIRSLLVRRDRRQRGIGSRLAEHALGFCRDQGYVKVALDAYEDQTAAIALFKRMGFKLDRKKTIGGRDKLEFYIDLYHQPGRESD